MFTDGNGPEVGRISRVGVIGFDKHKKWKVIIGEV